MNPNLELDSVQCMKNNQMSKLRSYTFVLLLAGFASGCGGKYLRAYVHNPAALTGVTRESGNLTLKADPLLDRQSCQTSFGMDCLQKAILQV